MPVIKAGTPLRFDESERGGADLAVGAVVAADVGCCGGRPDVAAIFVSPRLVPVPLRLAVLCKESVVA